MLFWKNKTQLNTFIGHNKVLPYLNKFFQIYTTSSKAFRTNLQVTIDKLVATWALFGIATIVITSLSRNVNGFKTT